MRSGFHKPGAIPFLVLLVFSLLSLVPSLAKEWDFYNLRFGYIGYHRNDVRQSSRIRDGLVDVRSRVRATGSQCKSWAISCYSLSDLDRISRPRRAVPDTPPRSSLEAAAVFDTDPIAYLAEKPSTFTRGVRAFKSLFINQLGDNQIPNPLSTGSASSVVAAPTSLISNLSNLAVTSVSRGSEVALPKSSSGNFTASATGNVSQSSQYFLSHLHELWQQVCRVAKIYLESRTASHVSGKEQRPPSCSGTTNEETTQLSEQPIRHAREQAAPKVLLPSNGSNVALSTLSPTYPQPFVKPTHPPDLPATAEEQSKGVGHGPNSQSARGSCMAIVIGLIAGVMWF
ncbi:hypothetical protein BDV28DRAFT_150384 [Aspergillus coremiiformis]|uniref:Uncharacterized protein n=1 Tax=Aspergillus coremiiformis TaxID=138285 RepID=A0A5N6Z1K8_9EURO|nr:hypothetical protein BDV28DRAFT_150384 [Aspergillus coremiiformis]